MELDNVIKKSTLDVVFCGSSDSDISNNGTKENCAISSVIEKLYLMNGTEQTTDCQNILNNLNNNNNNNNNNTNAKKRWKILAKAIVKQRHDEKNRNSYASDSCGDEADKIGSDCIQASVRRFTSFDLVKFEHIANYEKDQLLGCPDNWYSYKIEMNPNECYTVNIHQANRPLTATDLMGFNNTGNICVWPSEEALAIVVLSELDSFTQKSVLELGGGMTCLAGLFLAKYGCTDLVLLTDGNSNSVENVRRTIRLNEANCYIRTMVLEWGRSNDFLWHTSENKFHYILSADCLFFDETRTDLIETIWHFLTVDGIAFVMAPQRGSTLDLFVTEAQQYGFDCLVSYRYNDIIWYRHLELMNSNLLYNENIHYPILIKMSKFNKSQ